MEQNIAILFLPIGLLVGGISVLEKNYMFGIDNYIDKLSKKHGVNIDKTTYCRFEGIKKIKTATYILILEVIFLLFEVKNLNFIILVLCIFGVIDVALYYIKRKKFISIIKSQS